MEYDQLLALAARRRSVRSFLDRPVSLELVERILAAAVEAPTSRNHQLNRFVVDDPDVRRAIHERAGATVARAPVSIVLAFRMGWNHNKLSIAQSLGIAGRLLGSNLMELGRYNVAPQDLRRHRKSFW